MVLLAGATLWAAAKRRYALAPDCVRTPNDWSDFRMKARLTQLFRWFGRPWTTADRLTEENELNSIRGEAAARGATNTEGTRRNIELIAVRYRSRRVRVRVIAMLIVVVAISAFLTAFTDNRVVHGISIAAVASAGPVALYLGVRSG
jgi:hypothetical protein